MTEQQLDAQGEAHEALGSAVANFGQRILSDPRMLGNLVTDLLPDLPRERGLLVTAAEADVAGELTQDVQEQHLEADTAVQLVARALIDRRSIDPAASMWVTTEYAQALGYPVRSAASPAAPPPGTAPPPAIPAPPPTVTASAEHAPPHLQTQPPPQDPTVVPLGGYSGYSDPPGPAGVPPPTGTQPPVGTQPPAGAQPPAPPWAQGGGSGSGGTPPPHKRRNLAPILAASGTALVVVLYFVVAAVAGIAPFSKSSHASPTATPTPAQHHSVKPTAAPSLSLAAGVAPLVQLLPGDVNPANCKAAAKAQWATPGLVKSLECYDSGLSSNGDSIYVYQMNSSANYQASWGNFNTWWPFNPASGVGCPPSGSNTQGSTPWSNSSYFPTATGQTLECGLLYYNGKSNEPEPTYAWSFPTEDAFIMAIADPNTTFSAIDSWWTKNSAPAASPSPATP